MAAKRHAKRRLTAQEIEGAIFSVRARAMRIENRGKGGARSKIDKQIELVAGCRGISKEWHDYEAWLREQPHYLCGFIDGLMGAHGASGAKPRVRERLLACLAALTASVGAQRPVTQALYVAHLEAGRTHEDAVRLALLRDRGTLEEKEIETARGRLSRVRGRRA